MNSFMMFSAVLWTIPRNIDRWINHFSYAILLLLRPAWTVNSDSLTYETEPKMTSMTQFECPKNECRMFVHTDFMRRIYVCVCSGLKKETIHLSCFHAKHFECDSTYLLFSAYQKKIQKFEFVFFYYNKIKKHS